MARGYPDYEGNKVGIYLIPEWAAKEGTDKNFSGLAVGATFATSVIVAYTVPVGKTLYITQFGASISASAAANGELNQIGVGSIYNLSTSTTLFVAGMNGGIAIALNKPIVIPAGETVRFLNINYSNHSTLLQVSAGGYEI